MTELGWAKDWIGKANREDQTLPVLQLRESAQRLGLIRKIKGSSSSHPPPSGCLMIPPAFGSTSHVPSPTGTAMTPSATRRCYSCSKSPQGKEPNGPTTLKPSPSASVRSAGAPAPEPNWNRTPSRRSSSTPTRSC